MFMFIYINKIGCFLEANLTKKAVGKNKKTPPSSVWALWRKKTLRGSLCSQKPRKESFQSSGLERGGIIQELRSLQNLWYCLL